MASGDDIAGAADGYDDDLAADLSRRLREAHRRVLALSADRAVQTRAARRLVAITDVAKRDLPTAARRLDVFVADLDAGRYR